MDEKRFVRLRRQLMESLEGFRELKDEEICRNIDAIIMEEAKASYIPLSEKVQLSRELFNFVRKLDLLQEVRTGVLYEFEEEGEDACGHILGRLQKKGELQHTQKLTRAGIRLAT